MQFWELINRSNFLKDKFKNIDDHFKEIEINGISNNSKNIKKKFIFTDNLISSQKKDMKKFTNIVISKSGNTTETIVNANILIKKKDKNIFITEDKPSYLNLLAKKLRADIIHHNNFIGGRYSVLSEVGMLPAELMGLSPKKFKQLNFLIKKKNFINSLISFNT